MLPNSIEHYTHQGISTEAIQAMFSSLNLSERHQKLILRYHQLATQPELVVKDTLFLHHVWEQAQQDPTLTEALSLIDELNAHPSEDQLALSDNSDWRTFLSEHITVLAEEKLKVHSNTSQPQLKASYSHVAMLCPDGSGIVNTNLQKGYFIRLDDQDICSRCKAKLIDHPKFIWADDASEDSEDHPASKAMG